MSNSNSEIPPVTPLSPAEPPPIPGDVMSTSPPARDLKKDIELTHIIYGLMAAGYITGGLGNIAAIILNYIKRDDIKGTWLEGHFDWQIRTFWWSLLWGLISLVLMFVIIGFFTMLVMVVWHIYRIAKGWIRLNDSKPMDV